MWFHKKTTCNVHYHKCHKLHKPLATSLATTTKRTTTSVGHHALVFAFGEAPQRVGHGAINVVGGEWQQRPLSIRKVGL